MARSVLFSLPGKMWRRHLLPPQPTALSLSQNPHMGPASSPVKRAHSSPVALLAFLEGQWGPPSSDESLWGPEDHSLLSWQHTVQAACHLSRPPEEEPV